MSETNPNHAREMEVPAELKEAPKSPEAKPQSATNPEAAAALRKRAEERQKRASVERKTDLASADALSADIKRSFFDQPADVRNKFAKRQIAENKVRRFSLDEIQNNPSVNAREMPVITDEQIEAGNRGALAPDGNIMQEVSPLSSNDGARRMDSTYPAPEAQSGGDWTKNLPPLQPPAPAKKKGFFRGLFG